MAFLGYYGFFWDIVRFYGLLGLLGGTFWGNIEVFGVLWGYFGALGGI